MIDLLDEKIINEEKDEMRKALLVKEKVRKYHLRKKYYLMNKKMKKLMIIMKTIKHTIILHIKIYFYTLF